MDSETKYPTPLEKVSEWVREKPDAVYLRQPIDGQYREFTWRQVDDQARRLAAAFHSLGLAPGDRVAILAKNAAEWFIADYGIQMAGLISVPLYPQQAPESIDYVLNHSGSRAIIVGKLDGGEKMAPGIPEGVIRIGMPYPLDIEVDRAWDELLAASAPIETLPEPDPDDVMTIVYTSGTTGNPKGVMLTYGGFSFTAYNATRTLGMDGSDRFISYLPLSHIAERMIVYSSATYSGGQVTFVESLNTFADNLQSAAPTVFLAVPRLWKKFQQQIHSRMPEKKLDRLLKVPLVSGVIRRRIRAALGLSQARVVISGASPIPLSLLEWYAKLGIEINEGYGMTENMAYGPAMNLPGQVKIGTVGSIHALPGNEVKLTEAGEIIVRSPSLMKGYYKDPEKTAETIRDGWLYTGDRGEIDEDGYLKIVGRVKDVFKTSKGKFVQPVKIEGLLAKDDCIEQVCVAGSGYPQPYALVELSAEARAQLPDSKSRIESSLVDTLADVNDRLDKHEVIDRLFVVEDSWTPENGLVTPTLKIKRHQIEERYAALPEQFRGSETRVVWAFGDKPQA